MTAVRSRGCARCGNCCEAIPLGADPARMTAPPGSRLERDVAFIAEHWHLNVPVVNSEQTWSCDQFDPESRECGAHERKPPICRDYPWYGSGPSAQIGRGIPTHCSYLGDLPPGQRPAGSRPLIPIEAI